MKMKINVENITDQEKEMLHMLEKQKLMVILYIQ